MKHIAASVSIFIRRHAALMFGLLMIVLLSIELCYLAYLCKRSLSIPRMAICFTDIAILMIPYWWLRGRWRVAAVVWCWVLSAAILVNVLCFRFWGYLLPLTLVPQVKNISKELTDSTIELLKYKDFLYLAIPTSITAVWSLRRWRKTICDSKISIAKAIFCSLATIILFLAIQIFGIIHRNHKATGEWNIKQDYVKDLYRVFDSGPYLKSTHFLNFEIKGFISHLSSEIILLCRSSGKNNLSDNNYKSILKYIDDKAEGAAYISSPKQKSLILIIVESLDSYVLGTTVNGQEVTETLDKLCRDSGTVWSGAVRTQASIGNSSDGQIMYNLGLLPALNGGVAVEFMPFLGECPTILRLLQPSHDCIAVFSEEGQAWGQYNSYVHFGYSNIFTVSDIHASGLDKGTGPDGAMLRFALQKVKGLKQPFFMQLLTYQMHHPATNKWVEKRLDFGGTGLSEDRRNYLNSTADFDRHLGAFIDGLKKEGLWDNTVLVIASDHNYPNTKKPDGSRGDIVFIAANCDTTLAAGPVNQVDVFPTVLDIMGVESRWRGVGNSMLGPRRGQSDPRQATVSDSILRSDFFKRL